MRLSPLFRDARYFQILFQSAFLCYGLLYLDWAFKWDHYIIFVGSAILTQYVLECIFRNRIVNYRSVKVGLPSALISALSLCLLLKVNHLYWCAFASGVAIASKYLFRVSGRHIFNPSAFGIFATILITRDAWLSPAQWGSTTILIFTISVLGYIVVTRVQKLDVSLTFLFSFVFLLFFRQVIYLHWPLDFFVKSISTGSLLLFSFFMISDPKTTPNHPIARILWGMGVAVFSYILATYYFINNAPIWVLIPAAIFVPVLNRFLPADAFQWHKTGKQPRMYSLSQIN